MKVEKLLGWVVAFEFFALILSIAAFAVFGPQKKVEVIKETIIEPKVEISEERFRTNDEWASLLQEVAYNEYKTELSDEVASEMIFFARIWGNYYDVPLETLLAQMGQESWYVTGLVNSKNANGSKDYGVMMVNDTGITDYNNANWKNPVTPEQVQNDISTGIKVGCWNYSNKRRILEIYGIETSEYNILCAYNAGQGKVRKGTIPVKTQNYVANIQTLKTKFF